MWRRKPNKWHKSNKIRGLNPNKGWIIRNNQTKLPRQTDYGQGFKSPYKRTSHGGYPRTSGLYRSRFNRIQSVSRGIHASGISRSRHGFAIAMGRGSAPGRPLALGTGSRGRTQTINRRSFPHSGWHATAMRNASHATFTRRNVAVAGGTALVGAGVYAGHRYRQRRVRRNYKGQFAGSY